MKQEWIWAVLAAASMVVSSPANATVTDGAEKLPRIFLDCQAQCYDDFLRTEVAFVDYVRDRAEADVHVQISSQRTGGNGDEYTFILTGLGIFEGTIHRIRHVSSADDTDLGRRTGLAEALKLGLVPFVTQTSIVSRITVQVQPQERRSQAKHDPWDSWVLTVRGDGELESEQAQREYTVEGNLGADRITPEWKISLGLKGKRRERRIDVDEAGAEEVVSLRTSAKLQGLVVKSLGDHWGVGGWVWMSSSSFDNEDLELGFAPGIEFNVFPYTDYARRELRALLRLQLKHRRYVEETIYDRTAETLARPRLSINYEQRERWGTLDCEVEASAYLHDPSKYRLRGEIAASVRLVRGLSVQVYVEAAKIRDQLGLPARGATPEEILLRQRQIASGFSFQTSVGISYSFGSIFNNVINPRFGD